MMMTAKVARRLLRREAHPPRNDVGGAAVGLRPPRIDVRLDDYGVVSARGSTLMTTVRMLPKPTLLAF